uniref:Uncharacterized protein n=1 Tax=Rhodopseudomonas palustris (strain BisA53) TaxID=316055 RepID=Q07JF4_RHOP5
MNPPPLPDIATDGREEIVPPTLATVWQYARASIDDISETRDRRGFRLLQWAPLRPGLGNKPTELSVEHEARLRPAADGSIAALQTFLAEKEGQRIFDAGTDDGLIVRRKKRAPGSQSVDQYWDAGGALSGGWTCRMLTFRRRIRTSKFMTWSADAEHNGVFNLELPPVAFAGTGVIARAEFNWIDSLQSGVLDVARISQTGEGDPRHPLLLAMRALGLPPPGRLQPALEHTTFREKYSLCTSSRSYDEPQELFQLNIDHMTVQSLRTGHVAQHRDIDISAARFVNTQVLSQLIRITSALSEKFGLTPASATKAWWGAAMLNELSGPG